MRTILLIFLILISCTNRNGNNGYEDILGQENVQTLNLLVADFEVSILKTRYPNLSLSDSYRQFVEDYCNSDSKNWLTIPSKIKDVFNRSQLKADMYYHPDSVWLLPNSTYDKVESDSILFLPRKTPYVKAKILNQLTSSKNSPEYYFERYYFTIDQNTNKDSILKLASELKYYNLKGKWAQAVYEMSNSTGFYKEYGLYKLVGNYSYPRRGLDRQKFCEILDTQNTLDASIKRIIVLECTFANNGYKQ